MSVHVWDVHVDSRYMSARCFFCFHIKPDATTVCLQHRVQFEPSVAKQLYNCNQLHQEVGVTCRLVTALAAQLGLKFLFANIVEVKQLGSTSVWHRQRRRRNKYRMIENIEKKKKKYLNHHTVSIISLICTKVLGFSGCMHSTFTFRNLPSTDSIGISSFMKSSAFDASVISSSTELPAATIDGLERKESKEYGRNLPTKLTMMRAIAQT